MQTLWSIPFKGKSGQKLKLFLEKNAVSIVRQLRPRLAFDFAVIYCGFILIFA